MLTAYFNEAPPSGDSSVEEYDFSLPSDAAHLAPIFSSISDLHRAVLGSGRECARKIAGKHPYETLQNLILFFEEHVNCREK